MGAFGELLIKTWGGDLDKYSGNRSQRSIDETTEEEREQFRYERKVGYARYALNTLTSNLMYAPKKAKNYTERIIKDWFKEMGYNTDIQNIMWNDYCSFLNKFTKVSIE